jgi:hypothetical protein
VDVYAGDAETYVRDLIAESSRTWERREDYVLVVTGRHVAPSCAQACLESIAAQRPVSAPDGSAITVGVVVVWDTPAPAMRAGSVSGRPSAPSPAIHADSDNDDDSVSGTAACSVAPSWDDATAHLRFLVEGGGIPELRGRATLVLPRVRRDTIANTIMATRQVRAARLLPLPLAPA